jgi:hypothetical protein
VLSLIQQTETDMTTITNTTGSKAVKISTDSNNVVRAMYVQIYKGEEDLIQAKDFANVKNAEKWANKILN